MDQLVVEYIDLEESIEKLNPLTAKVAKGSQRSQRIMF
jgi:hypothetical protein